MPRNSQNPHHTWDRTKVSTTFARRLPKPWILYFLFKIYNYQIEHVSVFLFNIFLTHFISAASVFTRKFANLDSKTQNIVVKII